MLAYLGLPWDEGVLKFYETERPVRTRKVNQARKRIYRVSVGRWKNHATELGPLLAALKGPRRVERGHLEFGIWMTAGALSRWRQGQLGGGYDWFARPSWKDPFLRAPNEAGARSAPAGSAHAHGGKCSTWVSAAPP